MSEEILVDLLDEIKNIAFERLGINENSSDKFNFATIDKTDGGINYIEYWVLINAYYDENLERFIKIDTTATSFGIQLQAKGTYPINPDNANKNTGVIIWRNPKATDVIKDNNKYIYTDWDNDGHIGALRRATNQWETFGVGSGWTNNLTTDSKGLLNVGGAGIELDGNEVYPYGRVTSSSYNDGTDNYYILGVLDNARHPTKNGEWTCDDNTKYAWFMGLKYPEVNNAKDTNNGKFVIMYNNMAHVNPYDNQHAMDNRDWITILESSNTETKVVINGLLRAISSSGEQINVVDEIREFEMDAITSNAVYEGMQLKQNISDAFDGDYNNLTNKPTLSSLGGTVTIEKNTNPQQGLASYIIKQGGVAISPEINIPKDFLVKSVTLETCTVDDNPVEGYRVGDLYIDFVVNVYEGASEEQHLYLNVNELVADYQPDNTTIVISNNVISVKPNVFADKVHTHSDYITINDVPSASTTTPRADTENGDVGNGVTWARSNHEHPRSNLYAPASHNQDLTTINNVSTVTVTVTYLDDTTEDIQLVKYTPPTP